MDANNAPSRRATRATPVNTPPQGGTVEPANRATVAIERFQTPTEPPAERFELRDPFADVTYRSEGELGSVRVESKPGDQVLLGERDKIVGYNVTWRYEGQTGELVMAEDPGDRLPIEDGTIAVAELDTPPQG